MSDELIAAAINNLAAAIRDSAADLSEAIKTHGRLVTLDEKKLAACLRAYGIGRAPNSREGRLENEEKAPDLETRAQPHGAGGRW